MPEQNHDGVQVFAERPHKAGSEKWQAQYLIGADGACSSVRRDLGIRFRGEPGLEQRYFGGRMFSTYVQAPEFSWPIMLIVPESDQLTIEVKIDPKDIEQIRLGQPALLRFSTFNLRETPEVNGTVSRIAADTSTDQRTGQSYYFVRIAMRPDAVGNLGELKLTPRMPVEAFIQTGERTLLSYLVKPFRDQLLHEYR